MKPPVGTINLHLGLELSWPFILLPKRDTYFVYKQLIFLGPSFSKYFSGTWSYLVCAVLGLIFFPVYVTDIFEAKQLDFK